MSVVPSVSSLRVVSNNPNKKGELASRKVTFGPWSRYAVFAVHTRFDRVQFFVADAERPDPVTNGPEIIRQADTLEEALTGLELEEALVD